MNTAPPAPQKAKGRPWLVWHSWMALPIWGYMLFICLTGTLAVVSRELLWLIDPSARGTTGGTPLPLSALIAAAEAAVPGGRVARLYNEAAYMAMVAEVNLPDGSFVRAWIDPVTGMVQALSTGASLPEFLRALHGWLLAPWMGSYSWGWYAVALLSLPMLGSLITGILAYKRFWKAYLSRPAIRFARGPRTWLGDLHRLGGAWSIWFVAAISLSGLWFLVQALLYDLAAPAGGMAPVLVPRDTLPVIAAGAPPPRPDVDALLAAAARAVPDIGDNAGIANGSRAIFLPATAYDPLSIHATGRVPFLYDSVLLNPFNEAVLSTTLGGDQPAILITGQILRGLHVGNFGGLAVKLVWFLFGVVLTSLVFTGMLIWSKRTLNALRPTKPAQHAAPAPASTPTEEATHA